MPQEPQSTGREDASQPSTPPQPSAQQRRHMIIQQRRNRTQTALGRRTSEPAPGASDSHRQIPQERRQTQRDDESKPSAPPNGRAVEDGSTLQQKLIEQAAEHSQDRRRWEDETGKLRSQVAHLEAVKHAAETSLQSMLQVAQRDLSVARKEIEQLRAEMLEQRKQTERDVVTMAKRERERRAEAAQERWWRDTAMCTARETETQRDREREDLNHRLVAASADAARMEAELGEVRGRYTAEISTAETRFKSELQAAATAAQKADQQYVACVDAWLELPYLRHAAIGFFDHRLCIG